MVDFQIPLTGVSLWLCMLGTSWKVKAEVFQTGRPLHEKPLDLRRFTARLLACEGEKQMKHWDLKEETTRHCKLETQIANRDGRPLCLWFWGSGVGLNSGVWPVARWAGAGSACLSSFGGRAEVPWACLAAVTRCPPRASPRVRAENGCSAGCLRG